MSPRAVGIHRLSDPRRICVEFQSDSARVGSASGPHLTVRGRDAPLTSAGSAATVPRTATRGSEEQDGEGENRCTKHVDLR